MSYIETPDHRLGPWLDMASAPRDLTSILALRDLSDGTFEHVVVWWVAHDAVYPWHCEGDEFPDHGIAYWMPLPPAPMVEVFDE